MTTKKLIKNSKKKEEPVKKEMPKELVALMNEINKKFGNNVIRTGAEAFKNEAVITRIPTSNVSLDIDLGGGIPVGRVTEINGGYSSTKTTQCMHILANALKMGYRCAFADAEGTSSTEEGNPDMNYLSNFGITEEHIVTGQLLFFRPDSLEEATELILKLQRSGLYQVGFIDSIAVLEPNKVLDSGMEDTVQMGLKQKLLGEFYAKYQLNNNYLVRNEKLPFTIVQINQLREKIGAYGDPEYSPGGRAKGFALSVDIRLKQGDLIKDKDDVVGQIVKYKIAKNKTYMRMKSGEFDIYLDVNSKGIAPFHTDNIQSIIVEGVAHELIEQGGAWFFLDRENNLKFQGLAKLVEYIRENDSWIEKLQKDILNMNKKTK